MRNGAVGMWWIRPWTRAAKVSDISEGQAVVVSIKNKQIALLKSDDHFCAIDNTCPHRGAPLAQGRIEDGQVTCSWHAWKFDVKTGECLTVPEGRIKTYPVKIVKDDVFVKG